MSFICTIFCNCCGEDLGDIGEDTVDIQGKATASGWVEEDEEHFCPGCWERRPMEGAAA